MRDRGRKESDGEKEIILQQCMSWSLYSSLVGSIRCQCCVSKVVRWVCHRCRRGAVCIRCRWGDVVVIVWRSYTPPHSEEECGRGGGDSDCEFWAIFFFLPVLLLVVLLPFQPLLPSFCQPCVQCLAFLQLLLIQPDISFQSFSTPPHQVLFSSAFSPFIHNLVYEEFLLAVHVYWVWWV